MIFLPHLLVVCKDKSMLLPPSPGLDQYWISLAELFRVDLWWALISVTLLTNSRWPFEPEKGPVSLNRFYNSHCGGQHLKLPHWLSAWIHFIFYCMLQYILQQAFVFVLLTHHSVTNLSFSNQQQAGPGIVWHSVDTRCGGGTGGRLEEMVSLTHPADNLVLLLITVLNISGGVCCIPTELSAIPLMIPGHYH